MFEQKFAFASGFVHMRQFHFDFLLFFSMFWIGFFSKSFSQSIHSRSKSSVLFSQ